MKKRIDEILALAEQLQANFAWNDTYRANLQKLHDMIASLDNDAGPGVQSGRELRFQVADGYANYIITKVGKRTVKVVHVPIMDAYTFCGVYSDGKGNLELPFAVAEQSVRSVELYKKIFAKKESNQ